MKRVYFAALALLLTSASHAETPVTTPAPPPSWMAGAWSETKGERWTEEFWTPERGGVMLGAGRSGESEKLGIFEHTRIVRKTDGTFSFFAQPFGMPPVEFPMVARDAAMIEFANPAHDYPQRVKYWREGKLLRAQVSLIDGSKRESWSFAPMGAKAP